MLTWRVCRTHRANTVALAGLLTATLGLSIGGCPAIPGESRVGKLDPNFEPTLDLRLRAKSATTQVFVGAATRTLTYEPELIAGDPARVTAVEGSYFGPIIRARTGDRLRVRLQNDLTEPTIIHWHGMRVPANQDGHPTAAVGPGDEFVYEFEVRDRAGTFWFHPHTHGSTASQVYAGLAGLLLVSNDEETAAGLPTGDFDAPLVIQDRSFDADNQLVYPPQTGQMMDGFLGDQVLVNGRPSYRLSVATRAYRLRLVNGSNSRTYKLAWTDGTRLIAIATDGGLLGVPAAREYVTLGPGERVDVWADFSGRTVGTEFALESLAFTGTDIGMDGMMMGGMGHAMHGGMKAGSGPAQSIAGPTNGAPSRSCGFWSIGPSPKHSRCRRNSRTFPGIGSKTRSTPIRPVSSRCRSAWAWRGWECTGASTGVSFRRTASPLMR
ncbi:MAG: multicopper oxidase domain-containing protein [Planctomycetia bacterium]|nr:MAG: multicopper oxidase domain-containing protein [Planctomycetia bacterium]